MTGIAAIGFALSVGLSNAYLVATGPPPRPDAAFADVTAYYTDNATALSIVVSLFAINAVLLSVAGAGAYARLRALEREGEAWSMVGLIGVLFIVLVFASVASCQLALVIAPETESLWLLHNTLFAINHVALAIAMLGLSLSGLRTGLFRRWHAYLGLTGATVAFFGAILAPLGASGDAPWVSYVDFFAFGLWLLFLLTFGVRMLNPTRTPEPALA